MESKGQALRINSYTMFGWVEMGEGGKLRKKKGEENVIFHSLVGVKTQRKENGWMGFPPEPTIYFPFVFGKKWERKW